MVDVVPSTLRVRNPHLFIPYPSYRCPWQPPDQIDRYEARVPRLSQEKTYNISGIYAMREAVNLASLSTNSVASPVLGEVQLLKVNVEE
jgi:hypothetical protein